MTNLERRPGAPPSLRHKEGSIDLRFSYVSPGGPKPVNRSRTALLGTFKITVKVVAITPAAR